MKHYVYSLFPDTAKDVMAHYAMKYGDDDLVRQAIRDDLPGKWGKSSTDYTGVAVARPDAKGGVQRHGQVLLDGRAVEGQSGRLAAVKPWDGLMILGHGILRTDGNGTFLADTTTCQSDNGLQKRTASDVADWLKPDRDNLDAGHVLVKLVMCLSGGRLDDGVPSDCFAKQLAIHLAAGGWKNAIVGGYKGEVRVVCAGPTSHYFPRATEDEPKKLKSVAVQAPAKKVDNETEARFSGVKFRLAAAKENLVYYHGLQGDRVDSQTVAQIKLILRMYPGEDNVAEAAKYLRAVYTRLRNGGRLHGLEEQVAETLLGRLQRFVPVHKYQSLCTLVRGE